MKILFVLLIVVCASLTSFAQSNRSIGKEEARRIAETFVSCSGFGVNRLQPKTCKTYKNLCHPSIFPCKFLAKKAYGFFNMQQNGEEGWTIVFRKIGKLRSKTTGVAVTMNSDGADIKISKIKVFLRLVDNKY